MPADASPRAGASPGALDRYALLVLLAVQLALFALTEPRGEFPLADDWAYAHSVRWLLDEHRIRLSEWIGMNLLPQTLAGGAAAWLFGYSFTTLRAVTQVVSVIVAFLTFRWFLATGFARRDALVATLVVIAAPVWGLLSNSFMTDLYGMLFAIPAATLFVKALSRPTLTLLTLATLLSVVGVLERQVVAVVPGAFAVAWLATTRPLRLRQAAIAVVPLIAVVCAEFAYYKYLELGPGVPEGQEYLHGRALAAVRKFLVDEDGYRRGVLKNLVSIVGYLGLFTATWALWNAPSLGRTARTVVYFAAAIIAVATFALAWWPPYRANNVIDAAGIGPFTLYDGITHELFAFDRSPGIVWRIAGIGTAFGIAMLGNAIWTAARSLRTAPREARGTTWFVATLLIGYFAPFVLTDYIDRYLLFALPFVLVLGRAGSPGPVRARRALAVVCIACELLLGGAATHDYFAWNRARWAAIDAARHLGATSGTLDGGFEYNGYYCCEAPPRPRLGKSWWWVEDDRFVVAFSVPPGYVERQRFPVDRWLPRTPATIFLSERPTP